MILPGRNHVFMVSLCGWIGRGWLVVLLLCVHAERQNVTG